MMNKTFFSQKRRSFLDQLENKAISFLFSGSTLPKSADQDFPFEVNRNFYYLTGINQEQVILVMIKSDLEIREMLFIAKNDPILKKWVGVKLTKDEVQQLSGIEEVHYLDDFENIVYSILNNSRKTNYDITNVYLDLERRNYEDYQTKALSYATKLKNKYPELKINNLYNIVIGLRMIKSPEEIAKIKESIHTTKCALEYVMKNIKPSLYEYQVQNYFDSFIRDEANKTNAFATICARGGNATTLHYTANNQKLEKSDLLLLDLGTQSDFYVSDISRTYPVSGVYNPRQKQIYEAVLRVNEACIAYLKPGLTWNDYNNYANNLLTNELKHLGLIKEDSEVSKYYYHSIGHMMGLDTHDPVLSNIPFKAGMVMTVEPGIYVEEEAIGVRIEDDILITDKGCINLSKDIIKTVADIEKYMN